MEIIQNNEIRGNIFFQYQIVIKKTDKGIKTNKNIPGISLAVVREKPLGLLAINPQEINNINNKILDK